MVHPKKISHLCSFPLCKRKKIRDNLCSTHLPRVQHNILEDPLKKKKEYERIRIRRILIKESVEKQRQFEEGLKELKYPDGYYEGYKIMYIEKEIDDKVDEYLRERRKVDEEYERTKDYFTFDSKFKNTEEKYKRKSREKQIDTDCEIRERVFTSSQKLLFVFLNIEPIDDIEEIRTAYKKEAIKLHPDKNIGLDTTEQFQTLLNAYSDIMDILVKD